MRHAACWLLVLFIALLAVVSIAALQEVRATAGETAATPDFSGLAWLEGDTFLAVHDAKAPKEVVSPRVSILHLPRSPEGVQWQSLDVSWPAEYGLSHDLESIARIPGTTTFLLVESGDDGAGSRRIYVADLTSDELRIRETAEWPVPITNVEGSAVARVGSGLIFLYAERAHGAGATQIAWAPLSLNPLAFGSFNSEAFYSPDPTGPGARPVSALEVDTRERLYVASAFDLEDDNGPFRSVVWEVGRWGADASGNTGLLLLAAPRRLATLDGLKVESIAAREHPSGPIELFVGTDDENYGGVIRPLPGPASVPPIE